MNKIACTLCNPHHNWTRFAQRRKRMIQKYGIKWKFSPLALIIWPYRLSIYISGKFVNNFPLSISLMSHSHSLQNKTKFHNIFLFLLFIPYIHFFTIFHRMDGKELKGLYWYSLFKCVEWMEKKNILNEKKEEK